MTQDQLDQVSELVKESVGEGAFVCQADDWDQPHVPDGVPATGTLQGWVSANCSTPFIVTIDFDEMKVTEVQPLW